MSKFKVGDKVRVLESAADNWYNGNVEIGEVGTVAAVRHNNYYNCQVVGSNGISEWLKDDDLSFATKSLDNLAAGDILIEDDGDEHRVIDVLPNSVLVSKHYDHDEAYGFYSIVELKADGWTVKQDSPAEEVTELSVADIEEKLGLQSGTLRVKKDN